MRTSTAKPPKTITALERHRRSRNLSLTQLGSLAGVHRLTIFRLEHNGMAKATGEVIQKLAKALDLPTNALLP